MPTGSYLTALIKAKQARLNRSSICSIPLALDIEDGCQHCFWKYISLFEKSIFRQVDSLGFQKGQTKIIQKTNAKQLLII